MSYAHRIIEEESDRIVVVFDGLSESKLNDLRIAFYTKIEVLKFCYFDIQVHYSNFPDTIICDRLAQLTLKTGNAIEEYSREALSKGEEKVYPGVGFKLKKKGPAVVYARDLEHLGGLPVEVLYGEMPLVPLYERQEIDIIAYAVRGTHSQNAGFSPGLCTFYEEDNELRFVVESYGQYTPKQLLDKLIALESPIKE